MAVIYKKIYNFIINNKKQSFISILGIFFLYLIIFNIFYNIKNKEGLESAEEKQDREESERLAEETKKKNYLELRDKQIKKIADINSENERLGNAAAIEKPVELTTDDVVNPIV